MGGLVTTSPFVQCIVKVTYPCGRPILKELYGPKLTEIQLNKWNGWGGMWVAATPPPHTNTTLPTPTPNASACGPKPLCSRPNPTPPIPHRHQHTTACISIVPSEAHLTLPSCVVLPAVAHLVLPDFPVDGHGRSGPVHDCLQQRHQLVEDPGIVQQARWEVGTG